MQQVNSGIIASPVMKTPNLDQLAQKSAVFQQVVLICSYCPHYADIVLMHITTITSVNSITITMKTIGRPSSSKPCAVQAEPQ